MSNDQTKTNESNVNVCDVFKNMNEKQRQQTINIAKNRIDYKRMTNDKRYIDLKNEFKNRDLHAITKNELIESINDVCTIKTKSTQTKLNIENELIKM